MRFLHFVTYIVAIVILVGCYEMKQDEKGRLVKLNKITGNVSVIEDVKVKPLNNEKDVKDLGQSIIASKPTYDSKGWTQESTGSSEAGPWINHSLPGTRYYRDANRIIYRVYPPGVKPDAEKANPFGLGDSTEHVPQ